MATDIHGKMVEMIENKGWLSIDSIYLDNDLLVNVPLSRGYIGIIKSLNCLVTFTNIDIVNTEAINNSVVKFDGRNLGHGQSIMLADLASLQRFNLSAFFKVSALLRDKPITLPNTIINVTDATTYAADLDALVDGELETTASDHKRINVAKVFNDNADMLDIDRSWYNMDYLKDVWFKNKFDFNEKISTYLNLVAGDLI